MTNIVEYRPSASLIIAARNADDNPNNGDYDYEVLMFKRTEATAYMLDHCVFPGGVFEESADGAKEWLAYFHECGITEQQLQQLQQVAGVRPEPLLTSGQHMARDISLRICALRETFEEVGVLLCRDRAGISRCFEDDFDRSSWQHRVHNDATAFLQLCRHLNVVPDLWRLSEWSVWRSPTTARKKYDTIYYFVALAQQPQLLLEHSEAQIALWATPVQFLLDFQARNIWLPPTQFYELSRLTYAHLWAHLRTFAIERSAKGSTLLWLVYYRCDGALIGTLPGDDYYPAAPERYTQTIELREERLEDFRQPTRRRHRLYIWDAHDMAIEDNSLRPIDWHYSPVAEQLQPHLKLSKI